MSTAERCPVCLQTAFSVVADAADYDLIGCDTCSLVRKAFRTRLNAAEIQGLQDSVYTTLNRTQLGISKKMALDRVGLLREFVTAGRLLEVGCATGEFLAVAGQYGFDAVGVDASRRHADYAVEQGLDVVHGRLKDAGLGHASFDAVVMFHLFEHLEDPNGFLQDVGQLVRPQGKIMIAVPNGESFTNGLFGYDHPVYQQADHLYFYSKETLAQILSHNGFEVLSARAKEYPHHLFTSTRNYLHNRKKATRDRRQPGENRSTGEPESTVEAPRAPGKAKRFSRNLPYLAGKILFPLLWPYCATLERSCTGHELIVVAQRV